MNPRPLLRHRPWMLTLVVTLIAGCAKPLVMTDWEKWPAETVSRFPGERWQQYRTPEQAGWSAQGLEQARELAERAGSAAFMVIYDGAILTRWGQTQRRFMCHSVRKSLLSSLYGIAIDAGRIDPGDDLLTLGIDDLQSLSDLEKSAKIYDLLKSRSGVYHPAAYETRRMKENRPGRGSHDPGSHWYYNNWDFNALATIYNQQTDSDLFDDFETGLAKPLQMQDFELRHTYYHLEMEHSRHPAYPFRMSARDLARFGLLFLARGRWLQTQLLSEQWVDESTRAHSTYSNGGYGYMWWTFPPNGLLGKLGTYAAFGYGGQAIYVVPRANLVFVHRADTFTHRHVNYQAIRNLLVTILKARVGAPAADPKLIPAGDAEAGEPIPTLSAERLQQLSGRFADDRFEMTIRQSAGRLDSSGNRWGHYYLVPKTENRFEAAGAGNRVEFVLDQTGYATAVRIWFEPERRIELKRVD